MTCEELKNWTDGEDASASRFYARGQRSPEDRTCILEIELKVILERQAVRGRSEDQEFEC